MNLWQWAARRLGFLVPGPAGGPAPYGPSGASAGRAGDAGRVHTVQAQVSKVVDGDTIKVLVNGVQETVRLLLIDTPETVHPTKGAEPFGAEASHFVKQTLPEGSFVTLELNVNERDKYNRHLAYVWVNGQMLNMALVAVGLAKIAYVSSGDFKYLPALQQAELNARMNGLGIWSLPANQSTAIPAYAIPPGAIKGTVSNWGDRIYHVPGGAQYNKTRADAIFATEYEAVSAGFRRSKR